MEPTQNDAIRSSRAFVSGLLALRRDALAKTSAQHITLSVHGRAANAGVDLRKLVRVADRAAATLNAQRDLKVPRGGDLRPLDILNGPYLAFRRLRRAGGALEFSSKSTVDALRGQGFAPTTQSATLPVLDLAILLDVAPEERITLSGRLLHPCLPGSADQDRTLQHGNAGLMASARRTRDWSVCPIRSNRRSRSLGIRNGRRSPGSATYRPSWRSGSCQEPPKESMHLSSGVGKAGRPATGLACRGIAAGEESPTIAPCPPRT